MLAIRSKFLGLFTAIVLAVPASVLAQPSYLCRISGQISTSCCCAVKHRPHREAQVERKGCCDVIEAAQISTTTVGPESARTFASPVVVAKLDARVSPRLIEQEHPPFRLRPTAGPPGPPRFLAHCSLLI